MDDYDNMPVEVRRANWGWFGEPWPSGICLKTDPETGEEIHPWEWNYDMRVDTPLGVECTWCSEQVVEGDRGQMIPSLGAKGAYQIGAQHRECGLRMVLGSYKHLTGNCPGDGSCHSEPDEGMSLREDAIAVWDWVQVHGVQ